MRGRTIGRAAAGLVIAVAVTTCGRPTAEPPTTVAPTPVAKYPLTIEFQGLIAFAPRTCDKAETTCDSLVALLPRADHPSQDNFPSKKIEPDVPGYGNFHRRLVPYPAHHPVLRFSTNYIEKPDDCKGVEPKSGLVTLPLFADDPTNPKPPGPDDPFKPASYQITVAAAMDTMSSKVTLDKTFETLPLLYAGKTLGKAEAAIPCASCLKDELDPKLPDDKQALSRLAARFVVPGGMTISAHDPIEDKVFPGKDCSTTGVPTNGTVKFVPQSRKGCKENGKLYECSGTEKVKNGKPQSIAQHPMASGTVQSGRITIALARLDGTGTPWSCTLTPAGNQGVTLQVLNVPAEELLKLPAQNVHEKNLEHVGLAHLVSDWKDWKYFPYPYPCNRAPKNGQPWCTSPRFAVK